MLSVPVSLDAATAARLEVPDGDLARSITGSLRYYLADRGSGRGGWPYPSFRRDTEESDGPETEERRVEIAVPFESEVWRGLVIEADRQEVEPDRLLEHAVLYYLADLDSGRVAERLAEKLD